MLDRTPLPGLNAHVRQPSASSGREKERTHEEYRSCHRHGASQGQPRGVRSTAWPGLRQHRVRPSDQSSSLTGPDPACTRCQQAALRLRGRDPEAVGGPAWRPSDGVHPLPDGERA